MLPSLTPLATARRRRERRGSEIPIRCKRSSWKIQRTNRHRHSARAAPPGGAVCSVDLGPIAPGGPFISSVTHRVGGSRAAMLCRRPVAAEDDIPRTPRLASSPSAAAIRRAYQVRCEPDPTGRAGRIALIEPGMVWLPGRICIPDFIDRSGPGPSRAPGVAPLSLLSSKR